MTARATADDAVENRLLAGRVRLRQPARGYRVAIDPVMLAAAVPAAAGCRALDLGCGVGAAALCLLARVPEARVAGLEIQAPLAALARVNAELNGCAERFQVVQGDIAGGGALSPDAFDEVFCNPPHQPAEAAGAPPDRAKALATHEAAASLADWVEAALRFARPDGGVTFVHRADRLDGLLAALRTGAGSIVVFPLWPAEDKAAKRVVVRARKGGRTPTRLLRGLVLHDAGGAFTPAADAVLRDGAALDL